MKKSEKKETTNKNENLQKDEIALKLIDMYFKDNPYNLVAHHLDSYNDFFETGIINIFRENNPIRFIEREDKDKENRNECLLYLGGKNGDRIYFGKPIIYDDISSSGKSAHYMYPNDARLRNMTYGLTIHYDVDVEFIIYDEETGEKKPTTNLLLEKIYLGRFPIMLQSNLCILKGLDSLVRFNIGECRNDYGGYFIIDGKEKVIVPQEKFADNMLYIREIKDDTSLYSHTAEIRSVSEDASKPIRTLAVKIVKPSTTYTNNQIVVNVPNVRKPVPLFILMRALGVTSDKSIIEYCLLDLEKNKDYVDLFIPSIHDANMIFNQETALDYIKSFTKKKTISVVLDILTNYLFPHIGEKNFLDKAYFLGYMVSKLLRVFTKEEKATDRDNFRFKRIELSGMLIYDLFREYYLIQKKNIALKIDKEFYYHEGNYNYKDNFTDLIANNYQHFFKERIVESGFRRAFKGNWGSEAHTKRLGVVQDLNRLSWNSFISQLRKLNLPLDSSAKVVGPRLLNSSQWGYIDPVDTPDGGNIGLHKHLSLSTIVTSGYSGWPLIKWLRAKTSMRILQECEPYLLSTLSKIFVNGVWIGGIEKPIELVKMVKLFRRNGLLPIYTSVSFVYEKNEVVFFTDSGRLTRPIFYLEEGQQSLKKTSFQRKEILEKINSGKLSWQEIVTGLREKEEGYNYKKNIIYDLDSEKTKNLDAVENDLVKNQSVFDYVDTSEEEGLLIARNMDDLKKNRFYTHVEWNDSLLFGVMGNQIIFPENNQFPRNVFSCGQSRQAVSLYHSNYQMRMDKMGVVLNGGQIPLVKSRFTEYVNREEQPYGVNTIVAIMSYTGYNVEDAILINEGSLKRGLFNTTYYTMYEAREESTKVSGSMTNSVFADVLKKNVVNIKAGYDYSYLDEWGLVKEGTEINDQIVVIGKVTSDSEKNDVVFDSSVFTKKGQLGFVDKAFITEGEEGFRIAKIRIREERLPAIGDKMASRAGQKGTIGLIIPEEDMPFTEDGLKPDLIINPHAIPSRMTIGQLIETVLGKIGSFYGGFGNCTAFETQGPNTQIYGEALVNAGFHSSGNQILYNGMTGEQIYSEIFMGPTYYMRLKHMVKDKINYRARGPNTQLTRQPVQGRANDGGLRIGEMERDGVMAYGASAFLNDSFMKRGGKDEFYMAVCNKTGGIAIYNPNLNLFLSPFADGPIRFSDSVDGKEKQNIDNISRFGRSFSIVRVPYSFKLLIQELQVMNVQMRIITEDNVDQLLSMSYSNNTKQLLKSPENEELELTINKFARDANNKNRNSNYKAQQDEIVENELKKTEEPVFTLANPEKESNTPPYPPNSPSYPPASPTELPNNAPISTNYVPGTVSPVYDPNTPVRVYSPHTPEEPYPYSPVEPPPVEYSQTQFYKNIENPDLKSQFDSLSERDKRLLMDMVEKKRETTDMVTKEQVDSKPSEAKSILEIEEPAKEDSKEEEKEEKKDEGTTKKISFNLDESK